MSGIFVPICGPVVGDTVYDENTLVARDVAITLPEVVPQTADVSAMGTMSLPIWQLLENMEASITKIGQDLGLGDVAITLPEVVPQTADVSAMGTMSLPIWQLLENMEASITKIGQDLGLGRLLKANIKSLEVRWAQTVTDADGFTKNVGCKAFLRGMSTKIPGIGIEVASPSENETTIMVTRYALYVDGEELFLVGCKAFLRGMSTKIPGIGIEVASPSENETTIMVTRYALYVDGEELFLVDRLAGIVRIMGKDYAQDLSAML